MPSGNKGNPGMMHSVLVVVLEISLVFFNQFLFRDNLKIFVKVCSCLNFHRLVFGFLLEEFNFFLSLKLKMIPKM